MQQLAPSPEFGGDHVFETMNAHDWTADLPQSDHIRFFRSIHWSLTSLGPLATWSPTLRLYTLFVLADPRPACLWWGPVDNLIAIYNDEYALLAGAHHPKLMGSNFLEGYPNLWPSMKSYFEEAYSTRKGQKYLSAAALILERKGWREEAFFSGSFVPVGMPPRVEGFINTTFEVTTQQLADRRTSMLNMLASVVSQNVEDVFSHILTTLETNPNDIPLAMLYRVQEGEDSNILRLQGHVGLPKGHRLIIETATIDSEEGLIPSLRRAGSDNMVIDYDERFDGVSWKGWGEPSKRIVILPIASASQLFGYLIFGTNPYRPDDSICQQFTQDLGRMVSSIVSSAIDFDSNKKRQEQLEADLAFSDLKLRHLIDHACVGMCHVSTDGVMLWGNNHYYELAGQVADNHPERFAFLDVYHDQDRPKAESIWEDLVKGADHVTAELRVKKMFTPPTGDPEPATLQVYAFPYRDDLGYVRSVMACTTDISRLKWAQTFQARLAAEAREAKRHQEAFIDVVSHELRNPLSAIVHAADAITNAVEECQVRIRDAPQSCIEALDDSMQSAKIISECANHQKRIIDDILTLSNLDSMLLSITPVAVKPAKLVDSIVKMFAAELRMHQIAYDVTADSSLVDLGIEELRFDPSRVTQIFINLLTNAIKFVAPTKSPTLSIRIGACLSEPRSLFSEDTSWAKERKPHPDLTGGPEWGTGEEVYLAFSVKDSGIGLKDEEKHKIFERFRQANVITHVKYGGSGLGLFISKELTEKQGGEIGVSSVFGTGSTFGFYVKTRRVEKKLATVNSIPDSTRCTHTFSESPHILIVEDNLTNQKILGRILEKAGCEVNIANHGLEALDTLAKQRPDIVLMDLHMPVLDGFDTMRQIRNNELVGEGLSGHAEETAIRSDAHLPIIALSGDVLQNCFDDAIAAGADRVLPKPFRATELIPMMKALLPQSSAPTTHDSTSMLEPKAEIP